MSNRNQTEESLPSGRTLTQTMVGVTQLVKRVFHGLDPEAIEELRLVGQMREYEPNHTLAKQDDVGEYFFVIMGGKVAITQVLDDGTELMLGSLGRGKYFGEMSLLDDTPRVATCTTLTRTQVLELTKDEFNRLVKSSPSIAYAIMTRVLRNLRENDVRALDALLSKTRELEKANADLQAAQKALLESARYKREFELAGEVQRDLLPQTLPDYDNFSFATHLGSQQASGDFYDVITLDNEHVGILLGDVADQGINASMFMAVTRSLFVVESKRSLSPMEVVQGVHDAMLHLSNTSSMFVMAFYGVLHRPTGMFSYVIAGQERPFITRKPNVIGQLQGRGNYLGLSQSIHLEERRIRLVSGDRLVLFSDGVVDVMNNEGETYSRERLQKAIYASRHNSTDEMIKGIVSDMQVWSENNIDGQDFALMIVAAK